MCSPGRSDGVSMFAPAPDPSKTLTWGPWEGPWFGVSREAQMHAASTKSSSVSRYGPPGSWVRLMRSGGTPKVSPTACPCRECLAGTGTWMCPAKWGPRCKLTLVKIQFLYLVGTFSLTHPFFILFF